jgi:uncharacterized protein with HEPN domain
MTEKRIKYLSDISMAIDLIEEFTIDILDFNSYVKDLKTQSAIERQLAIIGEALNILKKIEPDLEIKNSSQIISFRNRLVHSYDSIDNSIVWAIIKRHLKELKVEIRHLLE